MNWKKNLTVKCSDLLLWFFQLLNWFIKHEKFSYQSEHSCSESTSTLIYHLYLPFIFKLADNEPLTGACCLDSQEMAREHWAVTQSCSGPTVHLYSRVDVTSKRSDAHLKEKVKLKISSWLVFLLNKAAVQSWYWGRGRRKERGEGKKEKKNQGNEFNL